MLFVLFQIGQQRYVLEAKRIVEVVPYLAVTPWPQAPKGFAGIINFRGQPIPVVDLGLLAADRPASERLSTRILVVKFHATDGGERLLGLLAEQATQMLRKDPAEFVEPTFNHPAPYLGPFVLDTKGAIHWLQPDRLLSDEVRQLLCAEPLAIAS